MSDNVCKFGSGYETTLRGDLTQCGQLIRPPFALGDWHLGHTGNTHTNIPSSINTEAIKSFCADSYQWESFTHVLKRSVTTRIVLLPFQSFYVQPNELNHCGVVARGFNVAAWNNKLCMYSILGECFKFVTCSRDHHEETFSLSQELSIYGRLLVCIISTQYA